MKFNMNANATVVLTPAGANIYNAWGNTFPVGSKPNLLFAGETCSIELWQLMRIFGESLYNGMPQVPFLFNEITLKDAK